jgi:hypothetical protein
VTDQRLLAHLEAIDRSLSDISANLALVAGELRKANDRADADRKADREATPAFEAALRRLRDMEARR